MDSRGLLVSTILVRSRRSPHHVCTCRLADALGDETRDDLNVEDVAGVDEGLRGGLGKLCEARGSLLRGYESAGDVDGQIPVQVC